jgi:enamine deaminase RidA (YjgF/YER057c/UK114 family)
MLDQSEVNLNIVKRSRRGIEEIFITGNTRAGQTVADLYREASQWLKREQATLVCMDVLGRPSDAEALSPSALSQIPVMYLTNSDQDLAGLHIWAVKGVEVRTLRYRDRVIGRFFEDADCRYCRLTGILPRDAAAERTLQTEQVFEVLQAGLAEADMDYSHVVRTWFYNDRITDWYGPFNQIRTALYEELGVFDRVIPASTGIGSCNAQGMALVAGLLALVPKHDQVKTEEVVSPMQGEATAYGSSFSRAIEVSCPTHQYLSVSGTASINPEGDTVHLEDVGKQTELTLQVVDRILASRQYRWSDVTRAYGYFKYARDAHHFQKALQALELPVFPCNIVKNDVCRDNLLFELELDAVK